MEGDFSALRSGDRLGDFEIVHELGKGGMGVVYLAEDRRLGRQVALKVIAPDLAHDREFQRRFEAEARSAAAIDHPNAVAVYSAGSADGSLFIAMRLIEGTDLRRALAESGPLDPTAAMQVIAEVAAALDAAHSAGLVHRDVKPANILLNAEPGEGTSYLTDFGLTRGRHGSGEQLTGTGQWIGTLDYVAPEQMTGGRVDARTDVYALGCVLYEMLAGSVPFTGNEMQKLWGKANEPIPALPASTAAHSFDPVVARATARDPEQRFRSAGDLARAAAAAAGEDSAPLTERSIATGAAATGLIEDGASAQPTRRMKTQPPRRESPTTPMPWSQPTANRERHGGVSGRTAAIIGGSLVVAAGLIAAALVVAGGKGGGESRTVVSRGITTTVSEASPTETVASTEEGAATGSGASPSSTRFTGSLYSAAIPTGWTQAENDKPISNYLESTWHNPAEPSTTLLIDAQTPATSASATEDAETVRVQTSQASDYRELAFAPTLLAGRQAARWVFDISGDRRVDYFLNDCNASVAMLGSTSPTNFGAMAPTFHEVASSIEVPCE